MAVSTMMVLYLRYERMRISVRELAGEMGIKEATLRNHISDGSCPVATYVEGGHRWADVRAVGAYLDKRFEEASSAA